MLGYIHKTSDVATRIYATFAVTSRPVNWIPLTLHLDKFDAGRKSFFMCYDKNDTTQAV